MPRGEELPAHTTQLAPMWLKDLTSRALPLSCILECATTLARIVMVATSANESVGGVTTTACSSS